MKISQITLLIIAFIVLVATAVIYRNMYDAKSIPSVETAPESVSFAAKEEIVFEGEPTERYSARVDRVDVIFEHKDYTQYRLQTNGLVRTGELNTERGFADEEDATVYVLNWQKPEGEQIRYVRLTSDPTHLYNLDSNQEIISGSKLTLELI